MLMRATATCTCHLAPLQLSVPLCRCQWSRCHYMPTQRMQRRPPAPELYPSLCVSTCRLHVLQRGSGGRGSFSTWSGKLQRCGEGTIAGPGGFGASTRSKHRQDEGAPALGPRSCRLQWDMARQERYNEQCRGDICSEKRAATVCPVVLLAVIRASTLPLCKAAPGCHAQQAANCSAPTAGLGGWCRSRKRCTHCRSCRCTRFGMVGCVRDAQAWLLLHTAGSPSCLMLCKQQCHPAALSTCKDAPRCLTGTRCSPASARHAALSSAHGTPCTCTRGHWCVCRSAFQGASLARHAGYRAAAGN